MVNFCPIGRVDWQSAMASACVEALKSPWEGAFRPPENSVPGMDLDMTNGRSFFRFSYYALMVAIICKKEFPMTPRTPKSFRTWLFLLLTPMFLAACSSEEAADAGTGTGTPAAVDMGDVTLLITDAPTSAYDEVNVTAESVSLVGEGQEAPLMNRSQRFNLLDLRNTFRKLSRCKARVGTYNKVRFRIRDVEVVKYKANGLVERAYPQLRSNMVDLQARTQFAVDRLSQLIVKLDLDADASLGTDPTAVDPVDNPDGTVFDPNATVDVDTVPTDTTEPPEAVTPLLINQQGVVQNLTTESFELCDANLECATVNISPDTVVLNTLLQPIGIDTLIGNATVQVLGHLDVTTDAINALHVLQRGGQVQTYTGNFSGAVANDEIDFSITAGASAGETYPVRLGSSPTVYDSAGNTLDASALGDLVEAEVIGILTRGLLPGTSYMTPGVIILAAPPAP